MKASFNVRVVYVWMETIERVCCLRCTFKSKQINIKEKRKRWKKRKRRKGGGGTKIRVESNEKKRMWMRS